MEGGGQGGGWMEGEKKRVKERAGCEGKSVCLFVRSQHEKEASF